MTDRRLGQFVVGLGLLALALAALAIYGAIPPTAVQLPPAAATAGQLLMPQGWAFFTANPQEIYPQAFVPDGDGSWRDENRSLAEPADLFGLNRSLRAMPTEVALLLQNVPARSWHACDAQPARCLSAVSVGRREANPSALDDLCGDVGFVRQQVLPWPWRNTGTVMPSLVVRVEVSCGSRR
jgi:antimicrobial peptide system SdpA family protein